MRVRIFLMILVISACALPALWMDRDIRFTDVSLDNELKIESLQNEATQEVLSVGNQLIAVDETPVAEPHEVQAALEGARTRVPVRVLLSEPQTLQLGEPFVHGETPAELQTPYRIVSVDGEGTYKNLSLSELRVKVKQAASSPITVEVVSANHVVDGTFNRSRRGPTLREAILAAGLFALVLLLGLLPRNISVWPIAGLTMVAVAVVYLHRVYILEGEEWYLWAGYAFAGLGSLVLLSSPVRYISKRIFHRQNYTYDPDSVEDEAQSSAVQRALQRFMPFVDDPQAVAFVVGFNRHAVEVSSHNRGVRTSRASSAMHAGLSMLATEGGALPRPSQIVGMQALEPEDDPFTGVGQRLELKLAVPIRGFGDEHDIWAYIIIREEEEQKRKQPLNPELINLTRQVDSSELCHELKALAADELLKEVKSQSARSDAKQSMLDGSSASQVRTIQKVPSTSSEPPPEQQKGHRDDQPFGEDTPGCYIAYMERVLESRYPISDTTTLTPEQWEELDRLQSDEQRPFLILGPAGVGKEFRARLAHRHSLRGDQHIVVIDCQESPEPVIVGEIFGDGKSIGLMEAISGGTLVLKSAMLLGEACRDEIVTRCASCNVRLGFVERLQVEPNRMPSSIPSSIRRMVGTRWVAIASLHMQPNETVRIGQWWLQHYARRAQKMISGFSGPAQSMLDEMVLPANIDQLQMLCRIVVLEAEEEEITVEQIQAACKSNIEQLASKVEADKEQQMLANALRKADGNKSEAARLLGMSRGTLLRRLKKYNMM